MYQAKSFHYSAQAVDSQSPLACVSSIQASRIRYRNSEPERPREHTIRTNLGVRGRRPRQRLGTNATV